VEVGEETSGWTQDLGSHIDWTISHHICKILQVTAGEGDI